MFVGLHGMAPRGGLRCCIARASDGAVLAWLDSRDRAEQMRRDAFGCDTVLRTVPPFEWRRRRQGGER